MSFNISHYIKLIFLSTTEYKSSEIRVSRRGRAARWRRAHDHLSDGHHHRDDRTDIQRAADHRHAGCGEVDGGLFQ